MKGNRSKNLGFLLVSTALGAVGQLLFKYSFSFSSFAFLFYLSLGLLCYLTSTLIYLYVLSRVDLSWAYSIGGLAYVFAVILAAIVLSENVPLLRWIGVGVITLGTILIGVS